MKLLITPIFTRTLDMLKLTKTRVIPFKECPSQETPSTDAQSSQIKASELFSLFTADIIKEEVVFVR